MTGAPAAAVRDRYAPTIRKPHRAPTAAIFRPFVGRGEPLDLED